jgi:uncharacterized DUF497 family protein
MLNFKFFEYDSDKSAGNRAKHGIDFEEAWQLWDGAHVEFPLPYAVEQRFMVTGRLDRKFWSATITYRHEKIRIISVRRSRQKEIAQWQRYHCQEGTCHKPGREPDDPPGGI